MAEQNIVLVGGGHSHLAVLKRFGARPVAGVRLTLVARDVHTAYSGMLPGYIAGHYTYDQAHIDVRALARFAGCRLVHDDAVGLDLNNRRVVCRRHPEIPYDLLSLDIGSEPSRVHVRGAAHVLPIKPVDMFIVGWDALRRRALAARAGFSIAVVGAGAGGVELILSLQQRIRAERPRPYVAFHLVSETAEILPAHNARARGKFVRLLGERDISVHTRRKVVQIEPKQLLFECGAPLAVDAVVWVTHAAAPAWIAGTGLATTADGFIAVNDCLQSTSHAHVFAAGDIATLTRHPRPKSGVMAVREGPPLAENLRRAVSGEPLARFKPQRRFLALIGTGDRYAVAARGRWALEGAYLWRYKHWIDRRWVRQYQELPAPAHPLRAE